MWWANSQGNGSKNIGSIVCLLLWNEHFARALFVSYLPELNFGGGPTPSFYCVTAWEELLGEAKRLTKPHLAEPPVAMLIAMKWLKVETIGRSHVGRLGP